MYFEKLIRLFLSHPLAANILMGLLILLGLHSYFTLSQEIFPQFSAPEIVVSASVPGANVERIEKAVLVPLERTLTGIPGAKRLMAQASAGGAQIRLELARDADVETVLGIVKGRVDSIDSFPAILEGLTVAPRDDRSQLLWLHLTGRDTQSLLPEAEHIRDYLVRQNFISRVDLVGAPAQEIEVIVDPSALYAMDLTLDALSEQLAANNVDIDAGYLRRGDRIGLTAAEETSQVAQLATIPIVVGNTHTVPLSELAELRVVNQAPGGLSRLNVQDAIGLAIFRDPQTNPVQAVEQLNTLVTDLKTTLPQELTLTLWLDESRELTSRMTLLAHNGLLGIALVMGVLLLFTHWRIALWVAAGLPVVYLGALWGMSLPGVGLTLNVITLFGFLIVSGILVDDALVVSESIHQEYRAVARGSGEQHGTTHRQRLAEATLAGLRKVSVPAVFGVLTTIMAFLPLTQLGGDLGHAIGAVSWVIILCLLFSIVESKLILPAHLYHSFRRHGQLPAAENRFTQALMNRLLTVYEAALRRVLQAPGFTMTCAIAGLVIALASVSSGWVQTSLLPTVTDYELEAELIAPVATTLPQTEAVVATIETGLAATNTQLQEKYQLPYPPMAHFYALAESEHHIKMVAELTPDPQNPVTLAEFVTQWRSNIPALPVGYSLALSATADPEDGIHVQLEGAELPQLVEAAEELKSMLANYPGVTDIRDNYANERPEYRFELTEMAKAMGVTVAQVGTVLRGAVHGQEAQRLQAPGREVRVTLRYPVSARDDLNALGQLRLLHRGQWLLLSQLVDFHLDTSPASVHRVGGLRAVSVTAANDDALATADDIMDDLEEGYLETLVARYPGLTYRVEGEARESDEVQASLIVAAALAIFGVLALLALPFGSLRQPALILAILPFSLTGVIAGHALMGVSLSIMSFFGAIALIGVLVNDSLVLLYQLEDKRTASGVSDQTTRDVLIQTCRQRFRPILITSITTFFGVMPIIFESDPEALWLVPIALSLGVGILFGTVMTLLLLPALWVLTHRRDDSVENQPSHASQPPHASQAAEPPRPLNTAPHFVQEPSP